MASDQDMQLITIVLKNGYKLRISGYMEGIQSTFQKAADVNAGTISCPGKFSILVSEIAAIHIGD